MAVSPRKYMYLHEIVIGFILNPCLLYQMEPEVLVRTETLYYNLGEVFCYADKLKSLVEDNWATHIFWFPYNSISLGDYNPKNDELWVRLTNKAPPCVDPEDWDFYTWRDTKDYISQSSLSAISPLLGEEQRLVPYFNWVSFQTLKYVLYPSGEIYQELPHSVHFRSSRLPSIYPQQVLV